MSVQQSDLDSTTAREAIAFAIELDYLVVATAGLEGRPHIEVAGRLSRVGPELTLLVLRGFFGRTTLENLRGNPALSVLAWDPAAERGIQLEGALIWARESAVLDGYTTPDLEAGVPQVEHELRIRVEHLLFVQRRPQRELELRSPLS